MQLLDAQSGRDFLCTEVGAVLLRGSEFRDRHKKEIYEGDIVRYTPFGHPGNYIVGVVIYSKGAFSVVQKTKARDYFLSSRDLKRHKSEIKFEDEINWYELGFERANGELVPWSELEVLGSIFTDQALLQGEIEKAEKVNRTPRRTSSPAVPLLVRRGTAIRPGLRKIHER